MSMLSYTVGVDSALEELITIAINSLNMFNSVLWILVGANSTQCSDVPFLATMFMLDGGFMSLRFKVFLMMNSL